MNRVIKGALLGLFLSSALSVAGYIEIKTADGSYGYTPRRAPSLPYVCYDRRIRIFKDGVQLLKYEGCIRSRYSCRSIGKVRFGRYPSNRASRRALWRCRHANPRFVD